MTMKKTSIADLKNRLSEHISLVEKGEEIEVCKRNIPVARFVPIRPNKPNNTRLGCGAGTVEIFGDLTRPLIPPSDWDMLALRGK